jgi:hypothetical protein
MSELPRSLSKSDIRMDAKKSIGYDAQDFADVASLDRLSYLNAHREVPCPDRIQQEELLLLGRTIQHLCLRGVDGQRFLADDVLAGLESQHCVLEVMRMWTRDIDDVDAGILHESLV